MKIKKETLVSSAKPQILYQIKPFGTVLIKKNHMEPFLYRKIFFIFQNETFHLSLKRFFVRLNIHTEPHLLVDKFNFDVKKYHLKPCLNKKIILFFKIALFI